MFAFVMLWAYFNFSQYPADVRGEPGRRDPVHDHAHQPRLAVPGALPDRRSTSSCRGCCCCRATSSARRTGWWSSPCWLLFVRYADIYMMVSPEFDAGGGNLHLLAGEHASHFFVHWLDLAAPLAIGGLWFWMFFTELRQRPLLAIRRSVSARIARKAREATDGPPSSRRPRARPDDEYLEHAARDRDTSTPTPTSGSIVQFAIWLAVFRRRHPRSDVAACSSCSSTRSRGQRRAAVPAGGRAGAPGCRRRRGCSSSRRTRSSTSAARERATRAATAGSNKDAGTVRIPIAEAMRLTVERGLPSRPADATQQRRRNAAALMPADSSAGRTLERRRQ